MCYQNRPSQFAIDSRRASSCQHVEQSIEMTCGGMYLRRLETVAASDMNPSEGLPESQEILKVAVIARRATAAAAVEHVGCAWPRKESPVLIADDHVSPGVARVQLGALRAQDRFAIRQPRGQRPRLPSCESPWLPTERI
jgi:hypothetical protein